MNITTRIIQKIIRIAREPVAFAKKKIYKVQFLPPNYIFFNRFTEQSVVIDVGCGHEAEFSINLIEKFKVQAYGVDPTKKHAPFLGELERSTNGKFRHLSFAVTKESGWIIFHESSTNESGSILADHVNVKNDNVIEYRVESLTLRDLVRRVGTSSINFIKLDLEGAEYDLLESLSQEDVTPFDQMFIEFHHHCTNYSKNDTAAIVRNLQSKGFKVLTLDGHNYLFYKEAASAR